MRLDEPLLRLPPTFDAAAIAAEIAALPRQAWVPHPNQHPGNEAVRLVTTGGAATDDTAAPMAPTEYLAMLPGVVGVMAAIGAVWGRSRLMRLAAGAVVPPHVDTHFYWRTHVRLHVPIITNPDVLFTCAGRTVHMAAGECWIFDTFGHHHVRNGGAADRVHLVLDTVGSEQLWDLIDAARRPGAAPLPPAAGAAPLAFETADLATVMSPWELRYHIAFIGSEAVPDPALGNVMQRLDRLAAAWEGIWARFGPVAAGVPSYHAQLRAFETDVARLGVQHLRLRNRLPVVRQIAELVFTLDASLRAA